MNLLSQEYSFVNKIILPGNGRKYSGTKSQGLVWLKNDAGQHFPNHFIRKNSKAVILYSHGNGGSLGDFKSIVSFYASWFNMSVFAIEYPGYGPAEGEPSEESVNDNLRTAYQFLLQLEYPPENIILMGYSIGTGPTLQLASDLCLADTPPAAVVTIAAFLSICDIVRDLRGAVIVHLLADAIANRWNSGERVKTITCPILFIHGLKDEVIPVEHSQKLHELCASREKRIIICPDADHTHFEEPVDTVEPMAVFFTEVVNANESAIILKVPTSKHFCPQSVIDRELSEKEHRRGFTAGSTQSIASTDVSSTQTTSDDAAQAESNCVVGAIGWVTDATTCVIDTIFPFANANTNAKGQSGPRGTKFKEGDAASSPGGQDGTGGDDAGARDFTDRKGEDNRRKMAVVLPNSVPSTPSRGASQSGTIASSSSSGNGRGGSSSGGGTGGSGGGGGGVRQGAAYVAASNASELDGGYAYTTPVRNYPRRAGGGYRGGYGGGVGDGGSGGDSGESAESGAQSGGDNDLDVSPETLSGQRRMHLTRALGSDSPNDPYYSTMQSETESVGYANSNYAASETRSQSSRRSRARSSGSKKGSRRGGNKGSRRGGASESPLTTADRAMTALLLYYEALNRRDVQAALEGLDTEVMVRYPDEQQNWSGVDIAMEKLQTMFEMYPEFRAKVVIEEVVPERNYTAVHTQSTFSCEAMAFHSARELVYVLQNGTCKIMWIEHKM